MQYDIREIPFSVYGAYLVFGHLKGYQPSETLYLRCVHGQERLRPLFAVTLLQNGEAIPFEEKAEPGLLTLENTQLGAGCDITYDGTDTLRIRTRGCALRLYMDDCAAYQLAYQAGGGRWEINAYSHKLMATPLTGTLSIDAPWDGNQCTYIDIRAEGELALEEYPADCPKTAYTRTFDECAQAQREAFDAFLASLPESPARYAAAREKAALLNWSAVVHPAGHFRQDTMLMSKNWMINVWSWDHCFNAMALADAAPALAWDQFMLPFEHQDENGALPDCVGDMGIIRNFVKPPIHGLVLRKLMRTTNLLTPERMAEIYEPLVRWTDWWFTCRDFDGNGLPQYNHGNDSGWDNSTAFMDVPVVEGADLAAFLVLQLEVLSTIARELAMPEEAQEHEARAKALLDTMLAQLTVDGRLRARASGTHAVSGGDTLLDLLPVVLGSRLPGSMREEMLDILREENRFRTAHGFATESVSSPYYNPDGYWRGPIWAPSTWLLVEGLKACGEEALAREVSAAFCDMCAAHGFAENFDAQTGRALRDKAYTWTSSVFLLLANDLYHLEEAANA